MDSLAVIAAKRMLIAAGLNCSSKEEMQWQKRIRDIERAMEWNALNLWRMNGPQEGQPYVKAKNLSGP